MNLDTLVSRLTTLVAQHGSQRAAAAHLGISQSHLFDLLNGRRKPGPKTLAALGLTETVTYRSKNGG